MQFFYPIVHNLLISSLSSAVKKIKEAMISKTKKVIIDKNITPKTCNKNPNNKTIWFLCKDKRETLLQIRFRLNLLPQTSQPLSL